MASKVYYMEPRSNSPQTGLVPKMLTVFEAAGFDSLIKPGDIVAIKLHCGEWNNTAYLRPVYARALVDRVKALGGRPFVCDTTTIWYNAFASRCTSLDIMTTAERNGYNSATLGCPFICADGFMGTADFRVDLPEGCILKEAYIAEAIAAADVLEVTKERYEATNAAIADGCLAAVKTVGRDKVAFINLAIDISRTCDCAGFTDVPILPHLGVFASYDPVAIDKACVDKSIETEGIHGSTAEEMDVLDPGKCKFETCSPMLAGVGEEIQLNTGEIIGLGTRQYDLITVPEKELSDFVFPPDPRPVGIRLRGLAEKFQPFPYDCYDGKGFLREEEVDLGRVNTYYDNSK